MLGAAIPLLCSCSATPEGINLAPHSYFPSCETIKDALRCDAPASVRADWLKVDEVMLQLQSLEPKDERDQFVACKLDVVCPAILTPLSTASAGNVPARVPPIQ
jgi:hypothetical protein